MPRSLSESVITACNTMATATPFALLLELRTSPTEVFRFANTLTAEGEIFSYEVSEDDGEVDWNPLKFIMTSFGEDSNGNLPVIGIAIANVDYLLSSTLEQYNAFAGQTVILHLLVNGELIQSFQGQVSRASVDTGQKTAVCELGVDYLRDKQVPSRRLNTTFCPFQYGGEECGATDGGTVCTHKREGLFGCRWHENLARFGGELGLPKT